MGLQDLTPQLRTRLSRVERTVGFFVSIATLLLIAGFVYYIYHTAQRKGWFDIKVQYSTSLSNAIGLKPGDDVWLMGFKVGKILEVKPNDPGDWYGVTVYFEIYERNYAYGYIWLDSKVRVAPADFLGKRNLEIIKGTGINRPTVIGKTKKETKVLNWDLVDGKLKEMKETLKQAIQTENPDFTGHALQMEFESQLAIATNAVNKLILEQPAYFYTNLASAKPYWIEPLESPALTERLETVVNVLERALPNILNLTNQLAAVLNNTAKATAKLDSVLTSAEPLVTNLNFITGNIRDPKGSLGEWIIPTNINLQLERTLKSADATLTSVDTNLTTVVSNLNHTLENLANVTSNLNAQVQANTNILSNVSETVIHSDELVQGLKRHWLLRSAFKTKKPDQKDKAPVSRK
jgi:ABC-type transporter Mla subunit MlaD